jgi:hypothetical protein
MAGSPRLGSDGALVPTRGFSRRAGALPGQTAWVSHDGLLVVSSREMAHLPGSGEPPLIGPQWLVSVSRRSGGVDARCRVTDDDVRRVVDAFAMPAFDEDNHHPGVARHLWCPIDPAYQQACECKLTELTVDDDGYIWTTEADACRGCEFERLSGLPCTRHSTVDAPSAG